MTSAHEDKQKPVDNKTDKRLPYQPPAVIHHGTITTRAGSPFGLTGDPEKSGVDPADLFGDGS